MRISTKATLIAAFTVCASMGVGLLAREHLLTPQLLEIERRADQRDIQRFSHGMERYSYNLENRVKRVFAAAGLLQSLDGDVDWHPIMLQMAKIGGYNELDYFVLSDSSGNNAVLQAGELVDKNQTPPNATALTEVLNHILPRLDHTKGSSISGFMYSPSDGPLAYAAGRASWTSTRLPEVYIAIRRLNAETIRSFAEQLDLDASLIARTEFDAELKQYNVAEGQRSTDDTLYALFKGDDGQSLLPIRFHTDARAFDDEIFSPTVLAALGFATFAWVVVLVIAHRTVIRPLNNITATMRSIRQNNNYREKLVYRNHDELRKLVDECNELLRHVAEHTSQLEAYSYSDALTGIGNRRLFQERLDYQWKLARRKGMVLGAIMFDLDYFKQYNDLYGHEGGDQVLKRFAELLQATFTRETDVVARTGGEEFTVLLMDTNEEAACILGEKALQALRDQKIIHRSNPQDEILSVSAGVACLIPSEELSQEILLRRADTALYAAKANGRDQVAVYRQSAATAANTISSH